MPTNDPLPPPLLDLPMGGTPVPQPVAPATTTFEQLSETAGEQSAEPIIDGSAASSPAPYTLPAKLERTEFGWDCRLDVPTTTPKRRLSLRALPLRGILIGAGLAAAAAVSVFFALHTSEQPQTPTAMTSTPATSAPSTPVATATPRPHPTATPTPIPKPTPVATKSAAPAVPAADQGVPTINLPGQLGSTTQCPQGHSGSDNCYWLASIPNGSPVFSHLTWTGGGTLSLRVATVDGTTLYTDSSSNGSLTAKVDAPPSQFIVVVTLVSGSDASFNLALASHPD